MFSCFASFRIIVFDLSFIRSVCSKLRRFPYFSWTCKTTWKGFGALAQTFGRTAIPFIKKHIVPAAKRIGANFFEIAAPEIEEVVSSRKNLKTFAKDVGTKTVRKQLGGGKKKPKRRTGRTRPISRKSRSKISRSRKNILTI